MAEAQLIVAREAAEYGQLSPIPVLPLDGILEQCLTNLGWQTAKRAGLVRTVWFTDDSNRSYRIALANRDLPTFKPLPRHGSLPSAHSLGLEIAPEDCIAVHRFRGVASTYGRGSLTATIDCLHVDSPEGRAWVRTLYYEQDLVSIGGFSMVVAGAGLFIDDLSDIAWISCVDSDPTEGPTQLVQAIEEISRSLDLRTA